jgi:hypothetical protein
MSHLCTLYQAFATYSNISSRPNWFPARTSYIISIRTLPLQLANCCNVLSSTWQFLQILVLNRLNTTFVFKMFYTITPFQLVCPDVLSLVGDRSSFGRQVWFIESHILFVIFFLYIDLFIHLFLVQKACCYPVQQLNHFPVKYLSHFTCTPSPTSLSYVTAPSLDCLCLLSVANRFPI